MIPDGFSITRRPRILIEGLQSFTPRHGWHRHSHSVGTCRFHLHGAGHRGGFGEKMRTTRRRKPMRKSANWKRTCAPRKERGLQSARPFPNRRNPLLRLFHKTPRPRPRHSPHGNETGACSCAPARPHFPPRFPIRNISPETRGGTMPTKKLHDSEPFGRDPESMAPQPQAARRSSATITPWITSSRAGIRSG